MSDVPADDPDFDRTDWRRLKVDVPADVPIAWGGYSGVGEWIVSKAQIYPWLTIPLYAHPPIAAVSEPVIETVRGEVIRALGAILNVRTPDRLYDLDAIPRDPVLEQVQNIRDSINKLPRRDRIAAVSTYDCVGDNGDAARIAAISEPEGFPLVHKDGALTGDQLSAVLDAARQRARIAAVSDQEVEAMAKRFECFEHEGVCSAAGVAAMLRQQAAEIAALQHDLTGYMHANTAYVNENTELRKDAERLQWIFDGTPPEISRAAIDAAIARNATEQTSASPIPSAAASHSHRDTE